METAEDPRVTVFKLWQFWNAYAPMLVAAGNENDVAAAQPWNAYVPMLVATGNENDAAA